MTDREKVLKALKCCANGCLGDCPYFKVGDCGQLLSKEALELLKEQEPAKPVADGEDYRCNNCGTVIGWPGWEPGGVEEVKDKFCPECGRPVKWDD